MHAQLSCQPRAARFLSTKEKAAGLAANPNKTHKVSLTCFSFAVWWYNILCTNEDSALSPASLPASCMICAITGAHQWEGRLEVSHMTVHSNAIDVVHETLCFKLLLQPVHVSCSDLGAHADLHTIPATTGPQSRESNNRKVTCDVNKSPVLLLILYCWDHLCCTICTYRHSVKCNQCSVFSLKLRAYYIVMEAARHFRTKRGSSAQMIQQSLRCL